MSQSLGKVTAQTTRAIKADAIYTVGDVTGGHMVSRRRRCGCGCGCGCGCRCAARILAKFQLVCLTEDQLF